MASPTILSVLPRGYLPDLVGGLEITARNMMSALEEAGFSKQVAAAASSADRGSVAARASRGVRGPYRASYRYCGHQVFTDLYHPKGLEVLVARLRPSLLLCHVSGNDELVNAVVGLDRPTLFYLHSDQPSAALAGATRMRASRLVAVSDFVSRRAATASGAPVETLHPLIDAAQYQVGSSGSAVMVVNPHPAKGGQRVVEMARRLPHRTFLVVGGWAHTRADPEVVGIERSLAELPNVERIGHLADMRQAFRRSRCLLMPCLVNEAYGRAAAEAMIAGVPVLASDRGALPETVGGGGLVLSPEAPAEDWIVALEAFFKDDQFHAKMQANARAQAAEGCRQHLYIADQLVRMIKDLAA